MYSIVVFTEEESVCAVPTSWVHWDPKHEVSQCMWPTADDVSITRMIQSYAIPEDDWIACKCRVKKDKSKSSEKYYDDLREK